MLCYCILRFKYNVTILIGILTFHPPFFKSLNYYNYPIFNHNILYISKQLFFINMGGYFENFIKKKKLKGFFLIGQRKYVNLSVVKLKLTIQSV